MKSALTLIDEENAQVARAIHDPEYFGKLYVSYFPIIYNYIRCRIFDRTAADDLTSSTFRKTLDKISTFDPARAVFNTWILTIARNTVNDHLRTLQRRRWVSLAWLNDRASREPDPEQKLIQAEERFQLLSAVAKLSDRERDILALKYTSRLTNRSIAEMTGLNESNVGVTVHRAIKKLRYLLSTEGKNNE